MRRPTGHSATTLAAMALIAAAALLAAACAAPLKIAASADPLGLLDPGALAYARLSGRAARELAPALLSPAQAKSLAPLLERTKALALGLASLPSPGTASASQAPDFQAAFIGDYPFRAASLSLGTSADWKREKSYYFNSRLGLRAAVPGPGLVLASAGPLEGLLAAAKSPGPSPIPLRLEALASAEIVLWAPYPFSGLAKSLIGEAMDVPARGLLVAASPVADSANAPDPSAREYDATVVFVMEDAEAVRVYKGALRLAWLGLSYALAGNGGAVSPADFRAEGQLYMARGIRISAESLRDAIASAGRR
jgi:hypothetical protein